MFLDALIITSLFLVFAISHSILASHKFKLALTKKIGDKIAFYRLFYNLSAILFFMLIYFVSPKPNYIIYDLAFPVDIIIVILQIFSGIILLWTSKFINMREFLGLTQVNRFSKGTYSIEDLDEKLELRIEGPFKYSRHPIYLFSSLFLILRPTMDFFYLIFLINMLLYFYIGSYFEEKKLVIVFGDAYRQYQKDVPKIFPKFTL
ncbi:MAG: methyltransferase [Melioribacteraceae bacterium]|nr:methyltransferase [Melioribacteraceae bacterium]